MSKLDNPYEATLQLHDNDLIHLLQAEGNQKRSRSSLEFKGKTVVIKAKDVTAFKATIMGVIKLCEAYEKTASVVKNGTQ